MGLVLQNLQIYKKLPKIEQSANLVTLFAMKKSHSSFAVTIQADLRALQDLLTSSRVDSVAELEKNIFFQNSPKKYLFRQNLNDFPFFRKKTDI
jgi:hypothetical protein